MQEIIRAAFANGKPIRIYREGLEDGWADGYIAGAGPEFFALELIDKGIRFDGYNCLRYADVSECPMLEPGHVAFLDKALTARGLARSQTFEVDLSSLRNLIRTAAASFPLLTIHTEASDPHACYIGKVASVTDLHLDLRKIDPDAVWCDKPDRWTLREITRVDFGGAYEEALLLAGGDPPA
jgi:hypothetical protein